METINFYSQNDPYGYYSNFSPHPVEIDGKMWPTTEHYYQAMKFPQEIYQEFIRKYPKPGDSKRMGNKKTPFIFVSKDKVETVITFKENWNEIKDDVMRKAVLAKFTQHSDLRELLLESEDAVLVEHTENDSYWGDGGDGSGKNMLGKILMETRNHIKFECIFG